MKSTSPFSDPLNSDPLKTDLTRIDITTTGFEKTKNKDHYLIATAKKVVAVALKAIIFVATKVAEVFSWGYRNVVQFMSPATEKNEKKPLLESSSIEDTDLDKEPVSPISISEIEITETPKQSPIQETRGQREVRLAGFNSAMAKFKGAEIQEAKEKEETQGNAPVKDTKGTEKTKPKTEKQNNYKIQFVDKTKDDGRVIKRVYRLGNTIIGKEKAIRLSAVESTILNHETALKNIRNKKSPEFEYHTKALAKAKEQLSRENWSNSDYFRDLLKFNPKLSYRQVIERLYVSSPVNFRVHYFEDAAGSQTKVVRLGIITDLSNGFTNLTQLREFAKNANSNELAGLRARIEELKAPLDKKCEEEEQKHLKLEAKLDKINLIKGENKKFTKMRRAVSKSAEKLSLLQKQRDSLQYALDELAPENIGKAIQKRKMILQDQFLSLVAAQVSAHAENVSTMKEGSNLVIAQVSFLSPERGKDHDKTGWMHDEYNEMIDMKAIFDEFKDATLYFDSNEKGAYVDPQGNIHLPKNDQMPKTLTLKPVFFNMSAQGKTENIGDQKKINEASLQELESLFGENKLGVMGKILTKEQFGYEDPEKFVFDLVQVAPNLVVGLNCLSAKDRTGEVAHLVINDLLAASLGTSDIPEQKRKKFVQKARDDHTVAVKIAQDNKKKTKNLPRALKTTGAIPGITKGATVGIRLGQAGDFAAPLVGKVKNLGGLV